MAFEEMYQNFLDNELVPMCNKGQALIERYFQALTDPEARGVPEDNKADELAGAVRCALDFITIQSPQLTGTNFNFVATSGTSKITPLEAMATCTPEIAEHYKLASVLAKLSEISRGNPTGAKVVRDAFDAYANQKRFATQREAATEIVKLTRISQKSEIAESLLSLYVYVTNGKQRELSNREGIQLMKKSMRELVEYAPREVFEEFRDFRNLYTKFVVCSYGVLDSSLGLNEQIPEAGNRTLLQLAVDSSGADKTSLFLTVLTGLVQANDQVAAEVLKALDAPCGAKGTPAVIAMLKDRAHKESGLTEEQLGTLYDAAKIKVEASGICCIM